MLRSAVITYICSWLLWLMLVLLVSCEVSETDRTVPEEITYAIELDESLEDTAYLHADYGNSGARVVVYVNGMPTCREAGFVPEVAGTVNTRLPGTYYLTYSATDNNGKVLPALTRTVHVVENKAGFMSGSYDVACSCTAVAVGSHNSIITAANYTAVVIPGSTNHHVRLMTLYTGCEYVIADAFLKGQHIEAGFFSPDYLGIAISGTLSDPRNTFTIESKIQAHSPATIYWCRNVYSRQLIIE
jgi:hypothetical protein